MTHSPERSGIRKDEAVTVDWLRKQALRVLLWSSPLWVSAFGFTWHLSAQQNDLHHDLKDATNMVPRIEARIDTTNAKIDAVAEQMRRTNKILDSVLTLMAERERRGNVNPLSGR